MANVLYKHFFGFCCFRTRDALVDASEAPFSVIVVGIGGDRDFSNVKRFLFALSFFFAFPLTDHFK